MSQPAIVIGLLRREWAGCTPPVPTRHLLSCPARLGVPGSSGLASVPSARLQLVVLDPRGTGMSSRDVGNDHSRDHYQRDIEAVVTRLKLGRFLLMGASFGVDLAVDSPCSTRNTLSRSCLGPQVRPGPPRYSRHCLPKTGKRPSTAWCRTIGVVNKHTQSLN